MKIPINQKIRVITQDPRRNFISYGITIPLNLIEQNGLAKGDILAGELEFKRVNSSKPMEKPTYITKKTVNLIKDKERIRMDKIQAELKKKRIEENLKIPEPNLTKAEETFITEYMKTKAAILLVEAENSFGTERTMQLMQIIKRREL